MRIFVYEFVTGGGWSCLVGEPPPTTFRSEGGAMLSAVIADFAALDDTQVVTLLDAHAGDLSLPSTVSRQLVGNVSEHDQRFGRAVLGADWTLVIAPELDGHLERLTERVAGLGGRSLGCVLSMVRLAGNKHHTAEYLRSRGIAAPRGVVLLPDESLPGDWQYPAVIKPLDGAGSMDVRLVLSASDNRPRSKPMRLEAHHAGQAASVAVLCGPGVLQPLLPCWQTLSSDGRFQYLGGRLPLPPELSRRATKLAKAAVATLPDPLGYVGVDLILGNDSGGCEDVVIEINPRLTTSYIGLRAASQANLASAMLSAAQGTETELSWRTGEVQFDATGKIDE